MSNEPEVFNGLTEAPPSQGAAAQSVAARRIYVASSWRNAHQPGVVEALRGAGHEVYDFRNPSSTDHGFSWREISPGWEAWDPATFRAALQHPVAQRGFNNDHGAMEWADTFVLVLPCGRSAHLEAGWACGAGKQVWILLLGENEPELMYKEIEAAGGGLVLDVGELIAKLRGSVEDPEEDNPPCWCGVKNPHYDDDSLDSSCGGSGTRYCHCGGDLCVCHYHGEMDCDGCEDCGDGDPDEDGDYEALEGGPDADP